MYVAIRMAPALQDLTTLLAGPCPAVLTTYRADGSALTSPVWVRLDREHFEMVMTAGDGKARNLRRDPRCLLVVFESIPPFRGVEARGNATIEEGSRAGEVRRSIARRYLGDEGGDRFTTARAEVPSVIVRISTATARVWDLSAILP